MTEITENFEVVRITPHPGPQTDFIASEADIAIYGGGAGGHDVGKGWALAFMAGLHFEVPGYVGVIFRRRCIDLTLPGAVREVAEDLYRKTGATSENYDCFRRSTWASGANVVTAFVKDDDDARDMGAACFAFVGFDELTEFTEFQFWKLASRARSDCGVRPHIRASVTADGASWVRELIAWWIGEDGFPIAERSGVLRWVARDGTGAKHWGDSREEATRRAGDGASLAASVTFIPGEPGSNPMHATLGQDEALRLRGNWNVPSARALVENAAEQEPDDALGIAADSVEGTAEQIAVGEVLAMRAALLERGHTDECYSGELVGCDCPLAVLRWTAKAEHETVESGRFVALSTSDGPNRPSEFDSFEYLSETPAGACRRVTETSGGESLTFEDDRRLPVASEEGTSELAKLEGLVRKMIDGNFGAGKFIIGGLEVYVADPRYTTAVSGGINVTTSRTGGK